MSCASSSGSSKAAKWPPRSKLVKRRRSSKLRCTHSRGGRVISAGKSATAVGHRDSLAGLEAPAIAGLGGVRAHRRRDRLRGPVDRQQIADVVLGEAPLDIPVAVRPAPVLVDQPGGKAGRGVVECRRERVGRGALSEQMERAAQHPALQRAAVLRLPIGHRRVVEVHRRRQHARGVEVQRSHGVRVVVGDARADDRSPVAALHGVALVVEVGHQAAQTLRDGRHVERLGRDLGEREAGQRGNHDIVAGSHQQRDQLEELDRRTRPAVDQEDWQAIPRPQRAPRRNEFRLPASSRGRSVRAPSSASRTRPPSSRRARADSRSPSRAPSRSPPAASAISSRECGP